jgi:hypothetical protein
MYKSVYVWGGGFDKEITYIQNTIRIIVWGITLFQLLSAA